MQFDRRDLAQADKLLVNILRIKSDHAGAKALNAKIQAKLAEHRTLLSRAESSLKGGKVADARNRVEKVLSEDTSNGNAVDLMRQIEDADQALARRCADAAQAGFDYLARGNLDQAARSLKEARKTGSGCDGARLLAEQLIEAEKLPPTPAPISVVPPPAPVRLPQSIPGDGENTTVLMRQLDKARDQLRAGNWSTAQEMAQAVKEMASSENTRREANKVISEATQEKAKQKQMGGGGFQIQ